MGDDKGGIRVRFAPSPTGRLHIGGARTALFNWLFARHKGGRFVLRIEDTDVERSSAELEEGLLEDLAWLGLTWDEGPGAGGGSGPYRQSERLGTYREYAARLVEEGKAYPCFCTDEELDRRRRRKREAGLPPHYDGTCRPLTEDQREKRRGEGRPESIRFTVPGSGGRTVEDIARGKVDFPAHMVGDFVIIRSSGMPTYNFAAAIDDRLMGITHVIRGAEHLNNTFRQVLVYEALGFERPLFAHIPLILGSDRSKLSKRHGAPNIADYRERGYPPEALVNYLAFLGWSTKGESEILSLGELVEEFDLERVSDSPSIFDEAKLDWVSASHVRAGGAKRYLDSALEFFPSSCRDRYDREELERIFDILSENLPCFSRIEEAAAPFSPGVPEYGEQVSRVLKGSGRVLAALRTELEKVERWEDEELRKAVKAAGSSAGARGKDLYMPLRAAVTGMGHGPDITSILSIKGREDVLSALEDAMANSEGSGDV